MLGVFGKNNLIRKAKDFRQCFTQYATAATELNKNEKVKNEVENAKRSRIPREGKKFKPLKANFLCDLFAGLFDLNVFEYPIPLTPLEVDSLLIHSDDVENFLKKIDDPFNVSPHLMSELKKLELFGLSIPQKYGGLGYTETETKFMLEVLSAIPFLGHLVGRNDSLCNKILTLQGTEQQKSHYLPMFASGDSFGCFAFLEKSPMIDIMAIQTQATYNLRDKHYVLNGNKKYVCNVDMADSIIVLNRGQREEKACLKNFFNYCIVDKNAPGVEVKKITSDKNDEHFGLHEINFDNVVVQPENIIGGEADSSFATLKMIMASNNLSASAVCLAMLKNLLHSAIAFCNTRTYSNTPLKNHSFIQNIIGQLTMYTYVVESVVYMSSGRFDIFNEPDLFSESCVAKLMAVEFLQLGIQNYLELVACDTFKMKNILEAAIKVLNYYSVMDETQAHLKLMIGSEGLIHGIKLSNSLKENVDILRKPYNYPGKILWFAYASREKRLKTFLSKFNLKMEVNEKLSVETDILQQCFGLMNLAVETQFARHGNNSGNDETCVPKFGEMAAYLYALTACISRASTSYCGYLENAEDEISITENFSFFTKLKVERLVDEIMYLTDTPQLYTKVGLKTFENKQYPPQHPLTRTY